MLKLYGLFTFFVESCGLYNVFSINQIKKTAYLDIYIRNRHNRHTASRAI